MRTLFVIRHGETEASARGVYSSRAEIPLTEEGRAQAGRAAERLRGAGIDAVRTSPLDRALDTAQLIAEAAGAPLAVDERLREIDYGPLEGLNRLEAEERFGAAYTGWRERPFEARLPGMEPLDHALERARSAAVDAVADARRPLLVAHQGILRLVLIALGQIGRDQYFETRLPEAEPREIHLEPEA
ncbi:MAG TPA: histidine phosphatase family protein [Solirubrobacterales bacterium]|nr:histidine phosphatase family protein [Solirubrobacterales bacterium]